MPVVFTPSAPAGSSEQGSRTRRDSWSFRRVSTRRRVPRRGIAAGASWPSLPSWHRLFRGACAESGEQYSSPKAIAAQVGTERPARGRLDLSGFLSAPGGPYLRDQYSRVVILHGVNAVYKLAPYELTVTPGQPNTFDAADARTIAGSASTSCASGCSGRARTGRRRPEPAAVCTPGAPANPTLSAATVRAYLAKVAAVVDLLGRYGIYTLLDMHQDVYNSLYRGEGAPAGRSAPTGCRSSPSGPVVAELPQPDPRHRRRPFLGQRRDGRSPGEYDRVWGAVAHSFADNPGSPATTPTTSRSRVSTASTTPCPSPSTSSASTPVAPAGSLGRGRQPIVCPKSDPRNGVVPTSRPPTPSPRLHRTDIYSIHGKPTCSTIPFPAWSSTSTPTASRAHR